MKSTQKQHKMKEFNLSEKREELHKRYILAIPEIVWHFIEEQDKEFIKRLKEGKSLVVLKEKIDNLAGEKLSK